MCILHLCHIERVIIHDARCHMQLANTSFDLEKSSIPELCFFFFIYILVFIFVFFLSGAVVVSSADNVLSACRLLPAAAETAGDARGRRQQRRRPRPRET